MPWTSQGAHYTRNYLPIPIRITRRVLPGGRTSGPTDWFRQDCRQAPRAIWVPQVAQQALSSGPPPGPPPPPPSSSSLLPPPAHNPTTRRLGKAPWVRHACFPLPARPPTDPKLKGRDWTAAPRAPPLSVSSLLLPLLLPYVFLMFPVILPLWFLPSSFPRSSLPPPSSR